MRKRRSNLWGLNKLGTDNSLLIVILIVYKVIMGCMVVTGSSLKPQISLIHSPCNNTNQEYTLYRYVANGYWFLTALNSILNKVYGENQMVIRQLFGNLFYQLGASLLQV